MDLEFWKAGFLKGAPRGGEVEAFKAKVAWKGKQAEGRQFLGGR